MADGQALARAASALLPTLHAELEAALLAYAAHSNDTAKPFRWTKTADDILQSVKRFCLHTSSSGH
jgi:hypothetical protein